MRLAASRPPEARGLSRDGVRLLVATPDGVVHARFGDLPRFLSAGDLLVVNTSGTFAAAVDGRRGDGRPVVVHFSSPLDEGTPWAGTPDGRPPGERALDGGTPGGPAGDGMPAGPPREGAPAETPGLVELRGSAAATGPVTVAVRGTPGAFLARHGRPIRYSYVPDPWPLSAYQTVFARSPGSAEMPSAGRPFTAGLVTDLVTAGVVIAPITLHAGVASLEAGEPPLPERFTVPEPTAELVNLTRAEGRRVVAVGTTCTRALEGAAGPDGTVRARRGWTGLVLGAGHPARIVTGLVTGWHDPDASHLALLEAVAGPELVHAAYLEAERAGYLWHEFGDSCLLLPPLPGAPAGRAGRRA